MDLKNTFSSLDFQGRPTASWNASHGVYEQKRHQFKSVDEYVHWHNEVKPHMSVNREAPETPIQAFQKKQRPKHEIAETAEPLVK